MIVLKLLFLLCFAVWLVLVTGAAIAIRDDGWGVLVIWALLTFSPIMSLIILALGRLLLEPPTERQDARRALNAAE